MFFYVFFHCRPNEEDTDNHSDEESFLSSHASDLGSPCSSRAPATPLSVSCYQIEDPFKRPLPIEINQEGNDLMIGARTRSKLPLNDTPLEHLELAFIPPDISTDMYDSDCDNEEWRKFLKVLLVLLLKIQERNNLYYVCIYIIFSNLLIFFLGICLPT
jgi:hypothetical protein